MSLQTLRPRMPQILLPERHHGGVWKRTVAQVGAAVLPAEDVLNFDTQVEVPYGIVYSATPTPTYELTAGGLWLITGHVTLEGTGAAEAPRLRVYDARSSTTLYVQEFIVGVIGGLRYTFTFAIREQLDFGAQIRVAFTSDVAPSDVVIPIGGAGCRIGFARLGR